MSRRAIRFTQILALLCFVVAGTAALRHFWAHSTALSSEELKLILGFVVAGICLSYPKLFFGWATRAAEAWIAKRTPRPPEGS